MAQFARWFGVCLALCSVSVSAHHKNVVVGFYDFAPLMYSDEKGQPAGPVYRYSEKILRRAGIKAQYREMPSARLYQDLRKGHVHIWVGAAGKPELTAYTLEGQRDLGTLALNLYYLSDNPNPHIPKDLEGKNLITLSGYSYWPTSRNNLLAPEYGATPIRTTTHQAALELLAIGRGDYLLNYAAPTLYHADKKGIALSHLPIEEIPMRFVISANAPHAKQLRAALDDAYDRLLEAGEDVYFRY